MSETGILDATEHADALTAACALAYDSDLRARRSKAETLPFLNQERCRRVADDLRGCVLILRTEAAILQGVGAEGSAAAVGDVSLRLDALAAALTMTEGRFAASVEPAAQVAPPARDGGEP